MLDISTISAEQRSALLLLYELLQLSYSRFMIFADPATWMLDISTITAEQRLGVDLADCYADSHLARWALIAQ